MASQRAGIALLFLTAWSQLVSAWPLNSPYVTINTRQQQLEDEYDYIIVGGGTSGLTVGDRLTEDGQSTVLVIEYGYFGTFPSSHYFLSSVDTGMNPKRMFNLTSQPCPELNNRQFSVGIGCVVGGSSSVNGQVFLRGTSDELDTWAELGNDPSSTWTWDGLLPYFKKGITLTPPDPAQAEEFNITYDAKYWGTESKIYATFGEGYLGGVMKVLYNAMRAMPNVNVPVDHGAGEAGLYWYTKSMDPQQYQRSYARTGHWDDVRRSNYEMIVGAKVNKILFDGDNASGVQWISRNDTNSQPVTVRARKEVILAAGTVHTPQVLMLSGIGPSNLLQQANIPVKVDLPGVGSNFQDHSYIPSIGYQWGTSPNMPVTNPGNGGGGPPSLAAMLGLPAVTPDGYEQLAAAFEAQDPTQYLPSSYDETLKEGYRQQHKVMSRLMRSNNVIFLEVMMFGAGGSVQNLHPMSRGTILIDPTNPEGDMIVDYRAATNPIDLDVMVENIKFMRRFMTTGELAQYNARETRPGTGVSSDEQLAQWARGQIIPSVFHPIGTCVKMPREWGGVVDEQLQVYGVNKLSIIDASIMPTIPGATTSMTVYAVAEKAADIIKERNA
ncbi:hypothetical protein AJ80_06634 [Polytolypa hystricis UAMH7299]|uniref:glucose oxidase n=1 Tax=Polytolypa hystricis (strain UAMH7299) TaxID=1447883 RepID=A0A2B7XVV2_POLH7|nr:hypothetical protein AJ80_06634 [Polytolypa hystricis UAMH7299]